MAPMRSYLLIFLFCLGLSPATGAGTSDWISLVFPDRTHDFGNVARGSQVRHAFPVVNRSDSEVHIASWRPKCGCTNVKVGEVNPPRHTDDDRGDDRYQQVPGPERLWARAGHRPSDLR